MENNEYKIEVKAFPFYLDHESQPEKQRYVFAYTINIRNVGSKGAKLLSRRWLITDANGHVEEVEGEGVVGQQPYLKPGEDWQYTSYAIIQTPVGTMQGKYKMISDDKTLFDAEIFPFSLALPKIIN